MSHQLVCIVHQQAYDQPSLLNTARLVEVGCKLRVSGSCEPDLIMSRAGSTAAFLFATESSGLCQGSATWAR